ncbi:MCP four helix bundle domain-containing protein, partial [Nitrosomonas sp. Nm166]|uniref:MCP four helix bundle domain-containing protein n=1 Tax=Nitrosomonas sp. Nm166 TaxID=1881054 RepID=UPI0008E8BFE5
MFKNMTVKTELILVLGLLSALLIGIGSLGVYGLNETNDSFKGVYEDRTVPLGDLGLILDRMQRTRLNTAMSAYGRNADIVKERQAMSDQRDAEIANFWQKYMTTNLLPEEATLAESFSQQWKIYTESRNRTMAFATAGNYDAAIANLTGDAAAKFDAVHVTMVKLLELQRDVAAKEYAAARSSFENIFMITATTITLGILLAVVLGYFLLRGIVTPLHEAIAIANAVASGDLSTRIEPRGTINGFDRLINALKIMNDNLVDLVGKVRTDADQIATAANEIASGNSDLSQRTEEQASSLEETASSMEELTS